MKAKIFIGLWLVLLLCFIPYVKADWSLVEKSGDWAICEPNHWKAVAGQYEGKALWSYGTLTNFTGYYGSIHIDDINAWVTSPFPWDSSAGKDVYVWFEFIGTNTNVKVGILFDKHVDVYGLLGKSRVWGCILVNSTEYNFAYSIPSLLGSDNYVEVWVVKENNILKVKIYHYASLLENPSLLKELDIEVGESWFSNVSMKLMVYHITWGGWTSRNDGCFEAQLVSEDFQFSPSTFPTPKPLSENIWDDFIRGIINMVNAIPDWIRGVLNYLYEGLKWITSIFITFFGMAFQMLPLFFPIIIFWFIDAVITSIEEGSFTPIGNMVYSLYDFIRGVIQTLANIIETIWDILTFWS